MIKFFAYLLAWSCFWTGHFVSKLMNNDWLFWLYPVYNRLMIWSCDLSDKYQLGIWKNIEVSDDSDTTE